MTVTRFAPSPTGFVHFGNLFPALTSERLAHQSGGVFFLRIEDTDAKREVKGAIAILIDSLKHYGISFDEGETWIKGKKIEIQIHSFDQNRFLSKNIFCYHRIKKTVNCRAYCKILRNL